MTTSCLLGSCDPQRRTFRTATLRKTMEDTFMAGSRSPVLLRISTPLAGERALCEVAKTATLAAHHSHSVDCKAERVRPGKCGNDTPIVSSASWCRLKTVTRYGR